jgi:hypothetical protein
LQEDDGYEQKDRAEPGSFSTYAFHRQYLQPVRLTLALNYQFKSFFSFVYFGQKKYFMS